MYCSSHEISTDRILLNMIRENHLVLIAPIVAFILTGVLCVPTESADAKIENSSTAPSVQEMEQHAETCASPSEEFVSPVRGSPRCCRKCEAGTGMLRLCTDVEDTKCRPCDRGSEFSPFASATAKCQQCRRCQDLHPLAKTRTPCTPTANTECECETGYYMSLPNQTCKPCTKCKPNEGVVKPCEWNADTQCQACPSGFWSATTEDSVKCVPCRTCTDDQVLIRECSVSSDTVCCPKSNQNCTISDPSALDYIASYPHDTDSSSGEVVIKQNQMLPIYCSIMGMIIISLLLYVVYKLWKQREAMTSAKLSEVYANGTGGLDKVLIRSTPAAGSATADAMAGPTTNSSLTGNYDEVHPVRSTSEIRSHTKRKNKPRDEHTAHEKHPLIDNVQSLRTDRDYLEKSIKTLPRNAMVFVCYNLAQNGWRELATVTGFTQNEMDQLNQTSFEQRTGSTLSDDLIQSIRSANEPKPMDGGDQPKPSEVDVIRAAIVVGKLCERPNMTLGSLCIALEKANRADLVPILTTNGFSSAQEHASNGTPTSS